MTDHAAVQKQLRETTLEDYRAAFRREYPKLYFRGGTMTVPKRMLMAEQWDSFARAVLPNDCPPDQRREMRRAFYAGAQGILFGVIAVLANDEREPTEEDMQHMDDLEKELSAFAEAVRQGRA